MADTTTSWREELAERRERNSRITVAQSDAFRAANRVALRAKLASNRTTTVTPSRYDRHHTRGDTMSYVLIDEAGGDRWHFGTADDLRELLEREYLARWDDATYNDVMFAVDDAVAQFSGRPAEHVSPGDLPNHWGAAYLAIRWEDAETLYHVMDTLPHPANTIATFPTRRQAEEWIEEEARAFAGAAAAGDIPHSTTDPHGQSYLPRSIREEDLT